MQPEIHPAILPQDPARWARALGAVGNAEDLLGAIDEYEPDVTVVEVRMPPGYTAGC